MTEPKTFASLTPTLLARKGGAKPAMRPQLTPLDHFGAAPAPPVDHDDLGWNDMGHDHDDHDAKTDAAVPAPMAEIVPLQSDHAPEPARPEVVRQQETLARRVESVAEPIPAAAPGHRAAFTLRLDAERHLKLRLACTVKGRSAQQLVTEALDKLLKDLPDLADIAERVEKSKR